MEVIASLGVRVAVALSLTLSAFVLQSDAQLAGHWEGTMVREGLPLEVSFDFANGAQPRGTFTSLTQKAMEFPLNAVSLSENAVHFVLGGSIIFDGKLSKDQIIGTFTDNGEKGDFNLRRVVPKPLPYEAVEVTFHNATVRLAGTLCMPREPGRHAAVVLLQGSGSETRWGTNRFIADRFARSGSAVSKNSLKLACSSRHLHRDYI